LTPNWGSRFPAVAVSRVAEIQLGKMLQPAPATVADEPTPYLRAGSLSRLDSQEYPEMFASPLDRGRYEVLEGDLLVAEGGDVGRAEFARAVPAKAIIQNSLHRLRPRPKTADARFIKFALDAVYASGWLEVYCSKSTFGHLTREKLAALTIPTPSLTEQRAISAYLDAETARIDDLAALRRRMIDLVAERLAVRTRLLVSEDAAGRPYPRVPLRRRWQVVDCKHRTPTYRDEGFPVVSPGEATPGRLDLTRCTRYIDLADFEDLAEGIRRPRRGDVIYTRNASIGIAAYVDTDEPFSMGQDVCLIRSANQDQRFLSYVLNTVGLDQLEEQKIGSTFSRINVARVMELSIPCPKPSEQGRVADVLDEATVEAAQLLDASIRQIDLLVERRQALITAAVTGQLEIPGVAA
jgi:type I restriction enzyme, S subunit